MISAGNGKDKEMFMTIKDWRQALRTPPAYRVGNSVVRVQGQLFTCLIIVIIFALLLFYSLSGKPRTVSYFRDLDKENGVIVNNGQEWRGYNATYPLTRPEMIHDKIKYRIGLVTDLDHSSRSKSESNTWESFYMRGYLLWNPIMYEGELRWDPSGPTKLKTSFSANGRGMELSELVTFDGKLLTFDDRSGVVYAIENDKIYPWIILMDGNGKTHKGFKAEWATVKDEKLYIGGMGKEWTTSKGEFISNDPLWVKRVDKFGLIEHLDWGENYRALRSVLGIHFPGYMLHESCVWSHIHKKWFFLPRRMSSEPYDEEIDEIKGTNVLLTAFEDFSHITVTYIGEAIDTHGFSSFKFVPGSKDEVIIALKTKEYKGVTETYIMMFTIYGKIISGETRIAMMKYEGLEFI